MNLYINVLNTKQPMTKIINYVTKISHAQWQNLLANQTKYKSVTKLDSTHNHKSISYESNQW